MGKKVYVNCKLFWAKLRDVDRDLGKNLPDGDIKKRIVEEDGHYLVNCVIDAETKKKMVADGIPAKGMQAQLFKTDNDGQMFYKAKRPRQNPKLKDRETGETLVLGPPTVIKEVDGNNVEWDFEEDGLIGNGSEAIVKFDVWDGKITTLEAIKIVNHVKYEADKDKF